MLTCRFKELRTKMGITQDELRRQFNQKFHRNYSSGAISMFETNKRIPEISALIDFADFFDVSLDYLVCRNFIDNRAQSSHFSLTPAEREHMKRYRAVSAAGRQMVDSALDYAWQQEYPDSYEKRAIY